MVGNQIQKDNELRGLVNPNKRVNKGFWESRGKVFFILLWETRGKHFRGNS